MTIRNAKLATILMIGAVVAASPAVAQSMGGSQGSGDLPVNRGAPITLPERAEPMPTPQVTNIESRDIFGLDLQALIDSLGTATLERDGGTYETPASDGLRAILESEFKGSTGG